MESKLKNYEVTSKEESIEKNQITYEEIVNANGHLPDKANSLIASTVCLEDSLKSCSDVINELKQSQADNNLSTAEEWYSDINTPDLENEIKAEEQEDDEETIATFVTAAGQQLALYAVENSEEIFAVTVYDESDKPPSNFQFLMKSDVERLIGQGAVRTVKKPSQMKKRVITTQPPIFYHKEKSEVNDKTSIYDTSVNYKKNVVQKRNRIERYYEARQRYSDFKINSKFSDNVHATIDKQSDITYLMMDNNFENIADQPDKCQDNFEDELIEHSTVQYIFLEADHQSDSELTFDEVQMTLRNMKKSLETNKKFNKSLNDQSNIEKDNTCLMKDELSLSKNESELESHMSLQSPVDQTYSSILENKHQLDDTLTDLPPSTTASIPQTPLKVKRSRKQQLISVNRDDGEIIIQPASMVNEELTRKKRITRRRQLSSQIRVGMTSTKRFKQTKRMKRTKQREVVEVIDLDIDEEDQQTSRNVMEITLDDNDNDGDKYSSDKENEIIMVRDSDSNGSNDEDDDEHEENDWRSSEHLTKLNGAIRCEYCSRNFRYRRTFNMHLLVCQKSPTKTLNLSKRNVKSKKHQKVKKQFTCKICQEKFDVVVALARHSRAMHSQRKKHKLNHSSAKTPSKSVQQKEEETTTEEEKDEEESVNESSPTKKELNMLARVKKRRKQRINYSLDTKKLNCVDCGRWFPSTAQLNAHSLQHDTKKSEKLHKCHICKKLIKSRLLFLRHLKMHNDTKSNSDSSSRMLRRKLRARPSTRKIASPRKRGRPRKF
ncbi:hypothetical protein PUN28_004186 [Cardiocondyla obscurior]